MPDSPDKGPVQNADPVKLTAEQSAIAQNYFALKYPQQVVDKSKFMRGRQKPAEFYGALAELYPSSDQQAYIKAIHAAHIAATSVDVSGLLMNKDLAHYPQALEVYFPIDLNKHLIGY